MGGARSRRKGHQFERDIANELKPIFPNAKRQLEYQVDDCLGVDIANTGFYKIQCKKYKSYVSINTISEIQCDRQLGDIPVLVTAGDGLESMAVIPFETFKRLIEIEERQKNGAKILDRNARYRTE